MPNKGYKHTKKAKEKIRNANLKNPTRFWLGKKGTEEAKEQLGKSMRGKKHTKTAKEKMKGGNPTSFKKGHTFWKGKKHSKKSIEKMSGKNHYNWQGGISFEPYTTDWTETLRQSIRERDNYTCQMLGCNKKQGDIAFDVHHIDYDKKNSVPDNLIALCKSCHSKTNFNRQDWAKYLGGINAKR